MCYLTVVVPGILKVGFTARFLSLFLSPFPSPSHSLPLRLPIYLPFPLPLSPSLAPSFSLAFPLPFPRPLILTLPLLLPLISQLSLPLSPFLALSLPLALPLYRSPSISLSFPSPSLPLPLLSRSPPPISSNILATDNRVSCEDIKATPPLSSTAEKLLSVIYYPRTICLVWKWQERAVAIHQVAIYHDGIAAVSPPPNATTKYKQ